jgi:hypothetical protein
LAKNKKRPQELRRQLPRGDKVCPRGGHSNGKLALSKSVAPAPMRALLVAARRVPPQEPLQNSALSFAGKFVFYFPTL